MALAVWFWLLLFLAALSGAWMHWPGPTPRPLYLAWGNSLFLFLLLVLLGIAVFGSPVK